MRAVQRRTLGDTDSEISDLAGALYKYLQTGGPGGGATEYPNAASLTQAEIMTQLQTLQQGSGDLVDSMWTWMNNAQGKDNDSDQAMGAIWTMLLNVPKAQEAGVSAADPEVLAQYISQMPKGGVQIPSSGGPATPWSMYQSIRSMPNGDAILSAIYGDWAYPQGVVGGNPPSWTPYSDDNLIWLLQYWSTNVDVADAPFTPQQPYPPPPYGPGPVGYPGYSTKTPAMPSDDLDPDAPSAQGGVNEDQVSVPTWAWVAGGGVGALILIVMISRTF